MSNGTYSQPNDGLVYFNGATIGVSTISNVRPSNLTNIEWKPLTTSADQFIYREPTTISASLYFKYVKKRLSKLQRAELDNRLKKLVGLKLRSQTCDQQGLLETVEEQLLVAAREQVLIVKGMELFVERKHVDKFLGAKNVSSSVLKAKDVFMCHLDKFPRPIPVKAAKAIEKAKNLCVFDGFEVLYTDYTKEPEKKSTADKIREKDPICFGTIRGAPNKLYFVADWIDEYCDLTFDKLVERFEPEYLNDPGYRQIEDDLATEEGLSSLTKRVQSRLDALNQTTRENWRQMERAHTVANSTAKQIESQTSIRKQSFLKRLVDRFLERFVYDGCYRQTEKR